MQNLKKANKYIRGQTINDDSMIDRVCFVINLNRVKGCHRSYFIDDKVSVFEHMLVFIEMVSVILNQLSHFTLYFHT